MKKLGLVVVMGLIAAGIVVAAPVTASSSFGVGCENKYNTHC